MRHFPSILTAAAFVVAAAPALAHDYRAGDIAIGHPWTRATPPMAKVGGGYLEMTNEGRTVDRLLGGSSPVAGRVEIHNMEMTDGIMKMRPVPGGVEIPAGETVKLAPGGYHFMLLDLKQPIAEGEMIPVTLEFEGAGTIDVELAAGPVGSTATGHGNATSSSHEGHD